MGKLKGILQSRYGKGLQVKFMQDVSSFEMEEEGFVLYRGDLHIPIQVNDKYLATAIVESGADLGTSDRETVSQLVRLFLEPEVFNWYVQQSIHNSRSEVTKDVVSIHEPIDLTKASSTSSTNVICLQTKNPHLIPRVAHNIHDISERWAYLRFSEIEAQIQSADDLRSLGTLTLLVEDVLQLRPELQSIIHQMLAQGSPSEEPLIVIGCTSVIEELESQKMIHEGLAKILKAHRLEIERLPKDPKLLQESLEIMLEF